MLNKRAVIRRFIVLLIVILSFAIIIALLVKRPASFLLGAENVHTVRFVDSRGGIETIISDNAQIEKIYMLIEPIRLFPKPNVDGTGWSYYMDFNLNSGDSMRFIVFTSHMVEFNQRTYYAARVPNRSDIEALIDSFGLESRKF